MSSTIPNQRLVRIDSPFFEIKQAQAEAQAAAIRAEAARLIHEAADLPPVEGAARLASAGLSTVEAVRFFAGQLTARGWISDDLSAKTELTREVLSRVTPSSATLLDVAEAYHRIVAAEACHRARVEADYTAAVKRERQGREVAATGPRCITTFTLPEAADLFARQLVAGGLAHDLDDARRDLSAEVSSRAAAPTLSDVVAAFGRMTSSLRPLAPAELLTSLKRRSAVAA
jgi:hypothetical protein